MCSAAQSRSVPSAMHNMADIKNTLYSHTSPSPSYSNTHSNKHTHIYTHILQPFGLRTERMRKRMGGEREEQYTVSHSPVPPFSHINPLHTHQFRHTLPLVGTVTVETARTSPRGTSAFKKLHTLCGRVQDSLLSGATVGPGIQAF